MKFWKKRKSKSSQPTRLMVKTSDARAAQQYRIEKMRQYRNWLKVDPTFAERLKQDIPPKIARRDIVVEPHELPTTIMDEIQKVNSPLRRKRIAKGIALAAGTISGGPLCWYFIWQGVKTGSPTPPLMAVGASAIGLATMWARSKGFLRLTPRKLSFNAQESMKLIHHWIWHTSEPHIANNREKYGFFVLGPHGELILSNFPTSGLRELLASHSLNKK